MNAQNSHARWSELSLAEQAVLAGHVGPGWLPQWFCNKMATWFKKLYSIADQAHHDFGYMVGGDAEFRRLCDRRLFEEMRADSARHPGETRRLAFFVSDLFYIMVRLFGWLSFQWRERSLTTLEIKAILREKEEKAATKSESPWKFLPLLLILLPLILFSVLSYLAFKLLPLFTSWRRRANTQPTLEKVAQGIQSS